MQVRVATSADLPALLPLIADYQRFYANPAPDDARNAAFFARFVAPSDDGTLLAAVDGDDGEIVGYGCLYWTFSSIVPSEIVLLNDLYVAPPHRGAGVGELIIAAALEIARERGASHLRWWTALDNRRAQRLYERVGALRSGWFEYEIATGRPGFDG